MPSDLEARIIRLEQLIPVVSRRLVKVRAVNGQLAQVLQSGGGVRAWNDGQPTGTGVFSCSGTFEVPNVLYHTNTFTGDTHIPLTWTGTGQPQSNWTGASATHTYNLSDNGDTWSVSTDGGGFVGLTKNCGPPWSLSGTGRTVSTT